MKQYKNTGTLQPLDGVELTSQAGRLVIPDVNTRFARPIVCPKTGEHV